jgi:hypothetical protein
MWYPSKYGADDILGAMNLITPKTILEYPSEQPRVDGIVGLGGF